MFFDLLCKTRQHLKSMLGTMFNLKLLIDLIWLQCKIRKRVFFSLVLYRYNCAQFRNNFYLQIASHKQQRTTVRTCWKIVSSSYMLDNDTFSMRQPCLLTLSHYWTSYCGCNTRYTNRNLLLYVRTYCANAILALRCVMVKQFLCICRQVISFQNNFVFFKIGKFPNVCYLEIHR